jgi:Zn finger protein HypA/HybF involved in hydrogenase expression
MTKSTRFWTAAEMATLEKAIARNRKKAPRHKRTGFAVICMECGRRFRTASMLPMCPRCKGTDIDVA